MCYYAFSEPARIESLISSATYQSLLFTLFYSLHVAGNVKAKQILLTHFRNQGKNPQNNQPTQLAGLNCDANRKFFSILHLPHPGISIKNVCHQTKKELHLNTGLQVYRVPRYLMLRKGTLGSTFSNLFPLWGDPTEPSENTCPKRHAVQLQHGRIQSWLHRALHYQGIRAPLTWHFGSLLLPILTLCSFLLGTHEESSISHMRTFSQLKQI